MNPFRKNHKQLSIFVTAGYPELNSLPDQIGYLEQRGVDFIEVGVPFSDPMADGPTIQKSSEIALKNGMTVSLLFDQIALVNAKVPLIIMSYFNPILHFGIERFLKRCQEARVSHVIVPDISLEVYEKLYRSDFEQYGVTLCFLITPRTSSSRVEKMSQLSSNGFLYLVSSNMTTGNTGKSLRVSDEELSRIRSAAGDTPLMIGFGIKTKADVAEVHRKADGAIIGSAYIKALAEGKSEDFISSVLAPEPQNP
ncbi:MAG: tryptophan synthase subunit alpha [bacterium]|nr:tryptophan synthase subunit alpha [bacterium]